MLLCFLHQQPRPSEWQSDVSMLEQAPDREGRESMQYILGLKAYLGTAPSIFPNRNRAWSRETSLGSPQTIGNWNGSRSSS